MTQNGSFPASLHAAGCCIMDTAFLFVVLLTVRSLNSKNWPARIGMDRDWLVSTYRGSACS
eukprot:COSAG05_NODE_66_length_22253_cov_14.954455_6_plen_61_part_00